MATLVHLVEEQLASVLRALRITPDMPFEATILWDGQELQTQVLKLGSDRKELMTSSWPLALRQTSSSKDFTIF